MLTMEQLAKNDNPDGKRWNRGYNSDWLHTFQVALLADSKKVITKMLGDQQFVKETSCNGNVWNTLVYVKAENRLNNVSYQETIDVFFSQLEDANNQKSVFGFNQKVAKIFSILLEKDAPNALKMLAKIKLDEHEIKKQDLLLKAIMCDEEVFSQLWKQSPTIRGSRPLLNDLAVRFFRQPRTSHVIEEILLKSVHSASFQRHIKDYYIKLPEIQKFAIKLQRKELLKKMKKDNIVVASKTPRLKRKI